MEAYAVAYREGAELFLRDWAATPFLSFFGL